MVAKGTETLFDEYKEFLNDTQIIEMFQIFDVRRSISTLLLLVMQPSNPISV